MLQGMELGDADDQVRTQKRMFCCRTDDAHTSDNSCTETAQFALLITMLTEKLLQVFQRHNSGHSSGTIGHLTNGVVSRRAYYEHTVTLALIPFLWPDLYSNSKTL